MCSDDRLAAAAVAIVGSGGAYDAGVDSVRSFVGQQRMDDKQEEDESCGGGGGGPARCLLEVVVGNNEDQEGDSGVDVGADVTLFVAHVHIHDYRHCRGRPGLLQLSRRPSSDHTSVKQANNEMQLVLPAIVKEYSIVRPDRM